MKVKTILVSQPEPKIENSPYFDLQEKQKVKIDFRPFIHVEGVSAKEIRHEKVDLNNYTAIILTSRTSGFTLSVVGNKNFSPLYFLINGDNSENIRLPT